MTRSTTKGKNMSSTTDFILELMNHLLEGANIPKVQVERSVGPVLGFFLADVLTETLREDPILSGKYVMLCPEFPLKKTQNNHSTNIDWLLFNETKKELVLLELKTSDTTFSPEQAGIYLERRAEIDAQGAYGLLKELAGIGQSSAEFGKYEVVRKKVANVLSDCRKARVLYLAPKSVTGRLSGVESIDKVLSFGDLAADIPAKFAEEWRVVRSALLKLDDSSRRKRNGQPEVSDRDNYESRADLVGIKAICAEKGAAVVVGFTGGESALRRQTPKDLGSRSYKWDLAESGRGTKLRANWIPGDRFLEIVNDIEPPAPGLKRSGITNQSFMLSEEQLQRYEAWVEKQFRDFLQEDCLEGLEVSIRFSFGPFGRSVEARVEGSDVRLVIEDASQL